GRVITAHVPTRLPALGQNVVEVGGRVVAVASGRPVVDTERIDVIPELTLERDIGRNDGVIEFDGHVTIHGSVLEGSILRVRGQLVVHGDVVASTACAGEGVWVRGSIVNADVAAGFSDAHTRKLAAQVRRLEEAFAPFHGNYLTLLQDPRVNGTNLRRLGHILLTEKHTQLMQLLDEVAADKGCALGEYPAAYRRLADLVAQHWTGIARTRLGPADVEKLALTLDECERALRVLQDAEPAPVVADSLSLSRVSATGTVTVRGAGVYASEVEAQSILVRGIVRGGRLVAQTAVQVGEIGTPTGLDGAVEVKQADGRIACSIRHPNVRFCIGRAVHRNLLSEFRVAYRGEESLAAVAERECAGP
ncbi:MAG: FapA family protein, partial [Alicyclobacillus shizuokensis]|nr:FapA family protein [Alicyclobacillus shizuokensis]